MHDDGHFGERVAARYDESSAEMFEPAAVDPVVDVLAALAGDRRVWPAEPDLMAQLAGMRLRERWGDWHRAPFTSDSRGHVSVWEKPAA